MPLCDQMVLPLDEDVCPRILAGKRVSVCQYLDALAEQGRIKAQCAAALDAFDVLATPTVGTPAIPLAGSRGPNGDSGGLCPYRESPRALHADGAQCVYRGGPAEWSAAHWAGLRCRNGSQD